MLSHGWRAGTAKFLAGWRQPQLGEWGLCEESPRLLPQSGFTLCSRPSDAPTRMCLCLSNSK